ncbi:hypothetical protein B0T11DRAFT_289661 [Plectosphaerella cucumerina]|uniref:Uncharacterized protein n=1 Tax=Plectosphaerella cucumerina TaxID=40658 RepID=A0A8K0T5Z5_9PEZI|nr:hypothetical protein B0T11DRAFT_289661 [Plectosphaerella cucumerina]
MAPRQRTPLGTFALACLLAAPLTTAQFKNDFSLYPGGTQGCLDDAATRSQCTGDDAQTMNTCLCNNGGNFINNAAICIGREAPSTLRIVWTTMSTSCSDSRVSIAVSEQNFIRLGEAEEGVPSTRTTAAASATGPSTAAPTQTTLLTSQTTAETSTTGTASQASQQPSGTGPPNDDDDEDDLPPPSDMSIAVMAGIGVAGAVVAGLIGGIAFIIWKRRRARKLDPRSRFYHLPDDSSRNPTLREWKPTDPYSPNLHGPPPTHPPPPSSGGLSVPGAVTGLGVSSAVSPVTATATSPYPPSSAVWTAHSPQAGWGSGNSYHSPTWTNSPVFPPGQGHGAFAELPSDRQAAHELDSIEVARPPVEMPAPYEGPGQSGPVWADIKPTKP